jgi:hypothetical protein
MSTDDIMLPTSPLGAAKRRALRRRSSSGGTMFVVAMTIAVLSTVGAWALQSAALEVRMAGYERQSTQTHYLTEYGLVATAQDLDVNAGGVNIIKAATGGQNVTSGASTVNIHAKCMSLPCITVPTAGGCPTVTGAGAGGCAPLSGGVGPYALTCYRWEGWTDPNFYNNFYSVTRTGLPLMDVEDGGVAAVTPGSFGPTNMSGTFSSEITDIIKRQQPPGASLNGTTDTYGVTITSFGQTSTANSTAGSSFSQGNEILRAQVEVQPVPQWNTGPMCP